MKYLVTVGKGTWEVVIDGNLVTVDGHRHHAELRAVESTPLRLLVLDGVTWAFPMESAGRNAWSVIAQGERHEVEVLDERAAHLKLLLGTRPVQSGPATLRAPMPGLVVRVLAEPGQEVAQGTSLIVLEAMKMENELKAAAPGIVESVAVSPGQTVEKGHVLISFKSRR